MPGKHFTRYSVYHVPTGALGDFGAQWLGWDCRSGTPVPNPVTEGWTGGARRYGFHATLKAPFRLNEARTLDQLDAATGRLAESSGALALGALVPTWLGRFLALVPDRPDPALSDLAAHCVRDIDPFRAPLTPQEVQKYAGRRLSEAQTDNLHGWGYPFIFDAFRFHLTLTDRVCKADQPAIIAALGDLTPLVQDYSLGHMSLVGEDAEGRFHEINRYALAAPPDGSAR